MSESRFLVSPSVRLSSSFVGIDEIRAIERVIQAGYLGMSIEVQAFEKELASFVGGERQVVCVNTGTSALHLAIQCCGIGQGDEVLVPTLTYVASFQAISATGALPVPCEVSPQTGFLDIADAERRVTSRTKAIMAVHYAGVTKGLTAVYDLADRYGLRVIEDAAHSFGNLYEGKQVGAQGDIICFSFDSIKNITCGEGGALVTGDTVVACKARDARLLGVENDTEKRFSGGRSWDFDVREQGWRYHMSDLTAAIGRAQLQRFSFLGEQRKKIAHHYHEFFKNFPLISVLAPGDQGIIPHIFPILIPSDYDRDELRNFLAQQGIQTGTHYKPNHLLSKFKTPYPLPHAELIYQQVLSLPLHPRLTLDDATRVTDRIGMWIDRTFDKTDENPLRSGQFC